jgi:hypothetical protein
LDFGLSHPYNTATSTRLTFVPFFPLSESGLGVVEYQQVATAVNKELAAPLAKRRCGCGTYTRTQRAMIGKFALENGNERARKYFLSEFPNLTESTIKL